MSANKRIFYDFTNIEIWPYNIIQGDIIYGPIYNKQKHENIRFWKLIISLYDKNNNHIIITNSLINNKQACLNCTATIIKSSGLTKENSKITETKPELITIGKNIGKINETTCLTQA